MIFNSVSWYLGLRYTLSRQRCRSVAFISRIAMVGIILGVALLIVVLSVMNGFDRELRERILSIMPQITLYRSGGIEDWRPLRLQLLEFEQVVAAAPFVELQGMANVGKQTEPLLIYGVDAKLEVNVSIIHQFLQAQTLEVLNANANAIVFGQTLAEKLRVVEGSVVNLIIPRAEGQLKTPAIRRVTVVDILTTGTEVDGTLALMGLQAAAELSLNNQVISGLHIKVDDLFTAPIFARQLEAQLPYAFYTTDWTRTHGNIYYAIQLSKKLVGLLLLLIISIAAFNVVSTLVMVVIDKHSDIAILRTLGLSARKILTIFMVQGALIGIIGTAIGTLLGLLLALSVEELVVFIESLFSVHFLSSDVYPISYLPSKIAWLDVVFVIGISLLMSFLATLYPAWRAAKVNPAEALRYE
ncbi:hypothetical protein AB835_02480 [Candidatus Endobugula sertula]|uniref:Cell division protein FtsX n=1 Tax=Candidatus Endobugula sertula TaxID=62101 RepID=A0A1D2QST3_9GAMM|nr:hypothetical protein AB835_02480 [Candidatus Endobugula sertula]